MKSIDVLKQAEKIENTLYVIREPTKKKYGYALRLCGDPMIDIMKTDTGKGGYSSRAFVVGKGITGKKWVHVEDKISIPVELLDMLIAKLISLKHDGE